MWRTGEDLGHYSRDAMMPTVWCPGCGNGLVLRGLLEAVRELGLDRQRLVVVGGIGCSGRAPFYVNAHAMHTTHGRALAFATGIKLASPELTVITLMGDGDALAIGGNHFIHACRRNLDLTAIVFNNSIYGMTGGQQGPTTPRGSRSATSRLGSIDRPLDAAALALAAGAGYVARTTTFDFQDLPQRVGEAIRHPGFALVEVLTQCPVYFGRLNDLGDASAMLDYEKELTVPRTEISREEVVGRTPIGVFRSEAAHEYGREYAELRARATVLEGGNDG
jgi:2-oxoglutarate ferredoxin oxidoreductase subunit beta